MTFYTFDSEFGELMKSVELKIKTCIKLISAELGLTPTQLEILSHLYEYGDMRIGDLSQKCLTADSNISSTCSRMERQGLITRTRQPDDQRTVIVSLTQHAKERMLVINNIVEQCKDSILEYASPQDIEIVHRGMKVLSDFLDRIDLNNLLEIIHKKSHSDIEEKSI